MRILSILAAIIVLFMFDNSLNAQTYSGFKVVNAASGTTLAITVDPVEDTVNIKITGPDSVWYSIAFGGSTMSNLYSYIIEGDGAITERKLGNHAAGSKLTSSLKDSSYSVTGGIATAIIKRNAIGAGIDYFTFPGSPVTIPIVWGYGVTSALSYPHPNRGATTIKLTKDCVPTSSSYSDTACDSYLSPSGNYTWSSTGTYLDTILNAGGCDSVITVNLEINNSSASAISPVTCYNYTSPSGKYTWITSGVYFDTIPNSAGCDSFITVNLIVNNTSSSISPSVCGSYISPSGKYTWDTSGAYRDTIPNSKGCDSLITILLTANPNTSANISAYACASYTSPSSNYTWTQSGTYYDTILNLSGCDSVITIFLTIGDNDTSISATSCTQYVSPSGNRVWTSSGIYSDTLINQTGCDSLITINLTIYSDTSVSVTDSSLISNATGAKFQWLDCGNNYSAIPGDTNQVFVPEVSGSYAVEVSENGCIDTSACHAIIVSGISILNQGSKFLLYPNPTRSGFRISSKDQQNAKVRISTMTGQTIRVLDVNPNNPVEIELTGDPGIYFVEIFSEAGKETLRVVKY